MNIDLKKLSEIYKKIYEITLEISEFIKSSDLESIGKSLDKRGILIDKGTKALKDGGFSEAEKNEIQKIIDRIKLVESENIKNLENKSQKLKKELAKTSISQKALSAYKVNKQFNPRLVDSKE